MSDKIGNDTPTRLEFTSGEVSSVNSTSTPLSGNGIFNGDWEELSGFGYLAILLHTDQPSNDKGLILQWSNDGVNIHYEEYHIVPASGGGAAIAPIVSKYVKIKYENGDVAQTDFLISVIKNPGSNAHSHPLWMPLEPSQLASVSKSAITGLADNGDYKDAKVNHDGALIAAMVDSAGFATINSPFHQLVSVTETPVIQNSFVYNLLSQDDVVTGAVNGTTLTAANSKATITTTTTIGSSGTLESRKFLVYRPGQGNIVRVTGIFDTGHTGSIQAFGIGSASEGFFFMKKGTTFGICRRYNGDDTMYWVPQSSWNHDVMDGSGSANNPSNLSLDTTKGQIYEIQYQWFGFGIVKFLIEAPNGNPVLVHVIEYPGTAIGPSLLIPSHPVRAECYASGGVMNMDIVCLNGAYYGPASNAMGHQFAFDDRNINVSTTEIPLLTLYSKTTMNAVANRIKTDLLRLTASSAGKNVTFRIYRTRSITGLTGGTFYDIDSSNSCIQYNSTATAVTTTGWRKIAALNLESGGSGQLDFQSTNEELYPGEYLVVTAIASANSSTVAYGLNWSEVR